MNLSPEASPLLVGRPPTIPSVVVVDPKFDVYGPLAASARQGKITLHFRTSAADALRLARRFPVDAWLIADDLDDMSGPDLIQLLDQQRLDQQRHGGLVAGVGETHQGRPAELARRDALDAGADAHLTHPITLADLESLLGLPEEERAKVIPAPVATKAFVTLPVGVGAAAVAIAMLMMS
jgi:CheY-like chemotaxis protein